MGHMSAYMHGLHTYCKCIVYTRIIFLLKHLENIYELIRSIKNIGDMYIYREMLGCTLSSHSYPTIVYVDQ
jgi:hypothetical protein